MKKITLIMALCLCFTAAAQSLVLLHTNDTHSNIDTDASGVGGILPRKAIIDSVRNAEKNVLLIDAGDIVQGTMYFKYFKGDVEYPLFNMMDYDIRVLGNHEFDNGLEELARHYKNVKADKLSANYDFSQTSLKGMFKPYVIKKIGNKKVGFFGINVNPESLILEQNYKGMVFKDVIETANKTAAELKAKGCDLIVAVTHIGYDMLNKVDDIKLAHASKDIDIIIGGHSHTVVDPANQDLTPIWIPNANGEEVLVTQTGKYGRNVGYIKLDLADFSNKKIDYRLIPVTDRFPAESYSKEMENFIAPYKQKVDSVNSHVIGWAPCRMENGVSVGALANWTGDFGAWFGTQIADSLTRAGKNIPRPDFALMNVGGIRQTFPAGVVTEGNVLAAFPFSNRMRLIEILGADLIETMKIVAPKGGEAVSSAVRVVTDNDGNFLRMLLNDMEIDPAKMYVVSTIDYVAEGNDDMTPMKRHRELWRDNLEVSIRVLQYVTHLTSLGLPVTGDPNPRFVTDVQYDMHKAETDK